MHENIIRLKAVNQQLKELGQDFVFVGGATVSLYATNAGLASEIRPTDDVDVIVELASYGDYSKLDKKLREIGFVNDVASGVICRYKIKGIIVDVMPTNPDAIGFSNRWYPEGFANAIVKELDEDNHIKIFSLPYFVATKWEAFLNRGKNDYRTSKDFEDLVYIWENVDDYDEQIHRATDHLKEYLVQAFSDRLDNDDFEEGIYAHLSGGYGGVDANYIKVKIEAGLNK